MKLLVGVLPYLLAWLLVPSSAPRAEAAPAQPAQLQAQPVQFQARSAALPSAAVPPARGPERLMLGYYVPYDATSWASLAAHADALDVVAAQWVTVDACGNLA